MEARGRVTSVIPPTEEVYVDHEMSADEAALVALGYKQEFKREFSVWTSFGVSFSVLGLLPSTASTLYVCGCFDCAERSMDWDTPVPAAWYAHDKNIS